MKTQQSLSYQFQSDVSYLFDKSTIGEDFSPNHMFKVENGSYPVLLMKTMNHDVIRIDTLVSNALGVKPDVDRIARADGKNDARRD